MKTTNVFRSAARTTSSFCAEMNIALLLDNSLLLSIFILLILGLLILPALLAPQKESTSGSAGFGGGRFCDRFHAFLRPAGRGERGAKKAPRKEKSECRL